MTEESESPLLKPKSGRRDKAYRAWIHEQVCAITGRGDNVVMHHVRTNYYGLGLRPDDRYAVPLDEALHLEGHRIGWVSFERKYKVDLVQLAQLCWEAYCESQT